MSLYLVECLQQHVRPGFPFFPPFFFGQKHKGQTHEKYSLTAPLEMKLINPFIKAFLCLVSSFYCEI